MKVNAKEDGLAKGCSQNLNGTTGIGAPSIIRLELNTNQRTKSIAFINEVLPDAFAP